MTDSLKLSCSGTNSIVEVDAADNTGNCGQSATDGKHKSGDGHAASAARAAAATRQKLKQSQQDAKQQTEDCGCTPKTLRVTIITAVVRQGVATCSMSTAMSMCQEGSSTVFEQEASVQINSVHALTIIDFVVPTIMQKPNKEGA